MRLRKLEQRKHRRAQGCFLIEGAASVARALAAGAGLREYLWCPEAAASAELAALREQAASAGAECVAVAPSVLAALTQRDGHAGPVASLTLPRRTLADLELAPDSLVVVADGLQDPGNLGTLIRTAHAAGAAALVSCTPAVDPWDPKAVRGSAGSVLQLPVVETDDRPALLQRLTGAGLRWVGAASARGDTWGDQVLTGGVALVLGHETRGLSPELQAGVEAWVHLPMSGGVESLNVAVAGSILVYRWRQLRGE